MIKLIHAADLHLDSPFGGLSPEMAAQRRQEQREMLSRLVELTRKRGADALLLCGDLLDTGRVFQETAQMLCNQLGEAGCPVLIAPGNHDYYEGRSPYATLKWPNNVYIFKKSRVEGVALPGGECVVYGAAFESAHRECSALAGFTAPKDGHIHVMALHGDVDGAGDYGPIRREDIGKSGLDYLALGHVHQFSGLQKEGDTYWAYPGCPEGRGFDELGEKGVLYVELEAGDCRAEFVPLGGRKYEQLSVDLTGAEDVLSAVRQALPQETQRDIYRILLTGERPEGLDAEELEKALSPDFFSLTVRDHTRPARKLWDRVGEDTLTGLFLREMSQRCQLQPEDETLLLAVRYGLAALEGGDVQ